MSNGNALLTYIQQRQDEGSLDLPVFDQVATKVYQAVQSGEVDADGLVDILEEDPSMASDVLRVSNSALMGGMANVTRLRDAVVRLGNKQIASLALTASQKRMYSASRGQFQDRLVLLWRHANAVAFGSRWLAGELRMRKYADEAFLAGLLHDAGKMSLLRVIEDLEESQDDTPPISDAVVDVAVKRLHTSHGAALLQCWNLPEVYQRVVADHHGDLPEADDVVLLIVRLVDRACAKNGLGERNEPDLELEGCDEANLLGVDEATLAGLELVLEEAASQAA